jgi:hypothetical protein
MYFASLVCTFNKIQTSDTLICVNKAIISNRRFTFTFAFTLTFQCQTKALWYTVLSYPIRAIKFQVTSSIKLYLPIFLLDQTATLLVTLSPSRTDFAAFYALVISFK